MQDTTDHLEDPMSIDVTALSDNDLAGAVRTFLDTRGRKCAVCVGHSPSSDGHDKNPACEEGAVEMLREALEKQTAAAERDSQGGGPSVSAVARAAEVLAGHQVASRGMTSRTPDECACEAKVMPAPGDDDINTRRARAFAAHQAEALAEAGLLPTDTEWGVRVEGRSAPRVWDLAQPGGLVRYDQGSEVRARHHMKLYPQHTLVRREVCEWVEVPS